MPQYLSKEESIQLAKENYIGRLGFISGQSPFIVPITYYYDDEENSIIGFTTEGHKIDSMRENGSVCLLIEEINSLKRWKSVLIHGTFEELQGIDSKYFLNRFTKGVKNILKAETKKAVTFISDFSNKKYSRNNAIVYRIKIWDVIGRFME
ncbi:pyridoxamine 5'-phosphate oxidase family protein [Maribacter sp. 2304DJ31-5]|uniref:pyridoxamine 5'-phosphate oxidase family protein n=1 Tax=Maribacter sp. 2304DJ31-5 TaxID=3386273 RepID=UPI0039BC7DFB